MLGDPLDHAALAGRVPALEEHEHPEALGGDPVLHLHELLLEPDELVLVRFLRDPVAGLLPGLLPGLLFLLRHGPQSKRSARGPPRLRVEELSAWETSFAG